MQFSKQMFHTMAQARAEAQIEKIARELFALKSDRVLPWEQFRAKVRRHCALAQRDHGIARYKHLKLLSLWQLSLGGILGPTARPDVQAILNACQPESVRMAAMMDHLMPEMA